MRKNFILLFVALTLAIGCSALDSLKTKNYSPPVWISWDEFLNGFIGKNISTAQMQFGYKHFILDLPEAEKAYTWENISQSGQIYGNQYWIGGSTETLTCQWSFIINERNTIIRKQWSGNNCPRTWQVK